jgi:hypothetical protein
MLQAGLQKHVLGQDYFFTDEHYLMHHSITVIFNYVNLNVADKCFVWTPKHIT